jgi:hypothetical protein
MDLVKEKIFSIRVDITEYWTIKLFIAENNLNLRELLIKSVKLQEDLMEVKWDGLLAHETRSKIKAILEVNEIKHKK